MIYNIGKLQPVFRLDIKRKHIALKTPSPNLKGKPKLRFPKHLVKISRALSSQNNGFRLLIWVRISYQTPCLSSLNFRIYNRGLTRRFASIKPQKKRKQGEISPQDESSLSAMRAPSGPCRDMLPKGARPCLSPPPELWRKEPNLARPFPLIFPVSSVCRRLRNGKGHVLPGRDDGGNPAQRQMRPL
jgi:hypothetical protein